MVTVTIPFGRGGNQEMSCIALRRVNSWLNSIHPDRFEKRPIVRDRLIDYQRECAEVLFRHFFKLGAVEQNPVHFGGVVPTSTLLQGDLFSHADTAALNARIAELEAQLRDRDQRIAGFESELLARADKQDPPQQEPIPSDPSTWRVRQRRRVPFD
jgi:hypothetical protein